ncbi:MAG: DEAD/DEAH box helicase [Deltaproteobacteria bacterium]|nr:DEAD/DEAH box helicase [Deltaproteobacteria bacterium]
MAYPYAVPHDLTRAPFWSNAEGLTMNELLDRLVEVDERATSVILSDVLDLNKVSTRAHQSVVDSLMRRETLGSWVRKWRPLPELVRHGRLEHLRSALARVGELLTKEASPPPPKPDLGPLGRMDVRVLAERRQALHIDVPPAVYAALPLWGGSMTVDAFLETTPGRQPVVRKWLTELAQELTANVVADAEERHARLTAWKREATSPLGQALLALRAELAARVDVPVTAMLLDGMRAGWNRLSDELEIEAPKLLSCMSGTCMRATVDVAGARPKVSCARGEAPCRLKLAAVEMVLHMMVRPMEGSRDLAEHLALPAWRRTIARLDVAARLTPVVDKTPSWVVKSRTELTLAWVEPKKSGGLKSRKLTNSELRELELERPADSIAMAIMETQARSYEPEVYQIERVAKALAALVGADHVYALDDKALVPVRVERAQPTIEVEAAAEGSRLVVRWGERQVALHEEPHPGRWTVDVDPARGVVRVGMWTRAACQAWQALRGADVVPDDRRVELAEALLALPASVAVKRDAMWLGEAHAPAREVVFRLGLEGPRGEKTLVVEGRVHPVPELGAMIPGDGDEVVPVRRDGRVGHVVRQLEDERRAVMDVAAEVGLPVDAHAPGVIAFDWRVVGLEEAVRTWTAIEELARDARRALRLEWKTKAPEVQRHRRVDKLRLRLGVKKDWLDVGGGFTLDGGELPLRELLQALRDHKRFVALDDTRVLEIGEALEKELAPLVVMARASDADSQSLRASLLATPLIAELEAAGAEVEGPPEWMMASQRLSEAAALEVPVPEGLVVDRLRPYQKEGIAWLGRLAHWARGACLADDMGLGKTLQALAFLLHRRSVGRALVVAPTSVVPNWLREARRFAPGLSVAAIARGADLDRLDGHAAVVVTSWDLVVRHEERFGAREWATLVLDEAHAMKNAATRRAQVAKALPAGFVLALTGTPVENRPSELWSLFQAVAPGLLGSAESFRETFARAIETGQNEAARRLGRLIRPFLLRRKKSEVASELPARSEVRVDVVLSADERERYEKVRRSALAELAKDGIEGLAGGRGMLKVLVVLTRLRQLACHPRLVEPKAGPNSSKLERLVELVGELRDEGRKALVFSQFTELLGLVRVAFDAAGTTYAYLDGGTPADKRIGEVDRFQAGEVDVFLLSLKAGGVGLNLTTATEVIHLDPWWNPAVEDQGTDRAHRIGQDKPVTVYRFVSQGTIEEQILSLHGDKRQMVANLLEGTASTAPITVAELVALLSADGLEAAPPEEEPTPVKHPVRRTVTLDAPALPAPAKAPAPAAPAAASVPAPAPAPVPAANESTLTKPGENVERVLALLREAGGSRMKRAELVEGAGLSDPEWTSVRAALDGDDRVGVEGVARGRTYWWRAG